MSVAVQQFHRAASLSSTEDTKVSGYRKIVSKLKENDYPVAAIKRAMATAEDKLKGPSRKKPREKKVEQILRLPFCTDQLRVIVNRIVRRSKLPIKVVHVNGASIKQQLVRSPLLPPSCAIHDRYVERTGGTRGRGRPPDDCITCQSGLRPGSCARQGTVYSMDCSVCGSVYVGETKRSTRQRFGEHHFQARNSKEESAWGKHMAECHPEVTLKKKPVFTNARVLATESSEVTRKFREAIEIRDRQPGVNRSTGWTLIRT